MNYKIALFLVVFMSGASMNAQKHTPTDEDVLSESDSLALATTEYITYIKEQYRNVISNHENLNFLLDKLPLLDLDEDYVIDDFRSQNANLMGLGSILKLYARHKSIPHPKNEDFKEETNPYRLVCIVDKDSVKPLNPFEYITLPYTKEAIWQAYLLSQTKRMIGMWWHGGYNHRVFINDYCGCLHSLTPVKNIIEAIDDCLDFMSMSKEDISLLSLSNRKDFFNDITMMSGYSMSQDIWDFYCKDVGNKGLEMKKKWFSEGLYPQVVLKNNGVAIISHCWFNDWGGLEKVTSKVIYNENTHKIKEIETLETKVIIPYDCGICF